MRELSVYYCPECGHYGFYQTPKNAVCPACQNIMNSLPMSYKNFMNMEYDMRDKLIANQIAGKVIPACSVVQRITEPEKSCDNRFTAVRLKHRIEELESENNRLLSLQKKLKDENDSLRTKVSEQEGTITWMHDMIWSFVRK